MDDYSKKFFLNNRPYQLHDVSRHQDYKGLVTFNRKIKKDSFYLYKAWWSKEPFVHICLKRFINRKDKSRTVRVYSNLPEVTLYINDEKYAYQTGKHVFVFENIPLQVSTNIRVVAGEQTDEAMFNRTEKSNSSYNLKNRCNTSANWV